VPGDEYLIRLLSHLAVAIPPLPSGRCHRARQWADITVPGDEYPGPSGPVAPRRLPPPGGPTSRWRATSTSSGSCRDSHLAVYRRREAQREAAAAAQGGQPRRMRHRVAAKTNRPAAGLPAGPPAIGIGRRLQTTSGLLAGPSPGVAAGEAGPSPGALRRTADGGGCGGGCVPGIRVEKRPGLKARGWGYRMGSVTGRGQCRPAGGGQGCWPGTLHPVFTAGRHWTKASRSVDTDLRR
jgi:hypothetical protein